VYAEGVSTQHRLKRLADELRAQGVESEYLARVEARITREQRLEDVQAEIAQEIASALGRTDMRVNLALAELELCRVRFERASMITGTAGPAPLAERRRLAEAFNAQRQVAQARLRDLLIHREAIGFRRNQVLNELYPIPARLVVPES
jgi:predicted DNA binding CopG/RHH family protein